MTGCQRDWSQASEACQEAARANLLDFRSEYDRHPPRFRLLVPGDDRTSRILTGAAVPALSRLAD